MRLLRIAKSYARQALARLEDAKEALSKGNHPYAVRLSQECVELSLKAVLRAVGIDYPKVHDVSDALIEVKDRFPDWFRSEMDFLSESSKTLVRKREASFYGGEEAFPSPDEIIDRKDSKDAVARADKTHRLCRKVLNELEKTPRARV